MAIGPEQIIARSVPLVPEAMPANQNPISRQAIAVIFSLPVECFQLQKQKIVTPKTAVENGTGLPENISNLPRKCSVSPKSNANFFENIMYIKKVVTIAILALFASL